MSKIISATIVILLWTSVVAADGIVPRYTINLNKPGALAELQSSNPRHFEKVIKLLEGLHKKADSTIPRWIKANSDARDVKYGPVLLTTDPPKKRLSFVFDDTRYVLTATLTKMGVDILPVDYQ